MLSIAFLLQVTIERGGWFHTTDDVSEQHIEFDVITRHQRVRSSRRSVPVVRADYDAADDVRGAHPT